MIILFYFKKSRDQLRVKSRDKLKVVEIELGNKQGELRSVYPNSLIYHGLAVSILYVTICERAFEGV